MDAALPEPEREVVVAAEPCGHGSKFEDIYRLLAEGCFPPSFCSIKRKNLKRYAQKFVVDGGDPRGQRGGGSRRVPAPRARGGCAGPSAGERMWLLGSVAVAAARAAPGLGIASGAPSGDRVPPGVAPGLHGCPVEDFTESRVQKSSLAVPGGGCTVAVSPGAAAAPELGPSCVSPVENDPFFWRRAAVRERCWRQTSGICRRLPLLRGTQEGGEARGDRGSRAEAPGLPGKPFHRDREPPGPEKDRAPHPEPVLLAGHRQGCRGLGECGAVTVSVTPVLAAGPRQQPQEACAGMMSLPVPVLGSHTLGYSAGESWNGPSSWIGWVSFPECQEASLASSYSFGQDENVGLFQTGCWV